MAEPIRERRRWLGNVAGWVSLGSALVLACECASLSNPDVNLSMAALLVPFCTGLLGALLSVLLSSWRWLALLVPWVTFASLVLYVLSKPMKMF